jgi:hypothetical protein
MCQTEGNATEFDFEIPSHGYRNWSYQSKWKAHSTVDIEHSVIYLSTSREVCISQNSVERIKRAVNNSKDKHTEDFVVTQGDHKYNLTI